MSQKKPPCSDCKRFKECVDEWSISAYYCDTGKRHPISGKNIVHGCWWYRYSPFCKVERKKHQ